MAFETEIAAEHVTGFLVGEIDPDDIGLGHEVVREETGPILPTIHEIFFGKDRFLHEVESRAGAIEIVLHALLDAEVDLLEEIAPEIRDRVAGRDEGDSAEQESGAEQTPHEE